MNTKIVRFILAIGAFLLAVAVPIADILARATFLHGPLPW